MVGGSIGLMFAVALVAAPALTLADGAFRPVRPDLRAGAGRHRRRDLGGAARAAKTCRCATWPRQLDAWKH